MLSKSQRDSSLCHRMTDCDDELSYHSCHIEVSSDHSNKNVLIIRLLLYRMFPVFLNKIRIKIKLLLFYDLIIATCLSTTKQAKFCVFNPSIKMSQISSTASEESKVQHLLLHVERVSSRYLGLDLVTMQMGQSAKLHLEAFTQCRSLNHQLAFLPNLAASWLLGSTFLSPSMAFGFWSSHSYS